VIVAGFITAILLVIIGTAMDKAERAKRDREWEEYRRRTRR
jgi:hypothetical protein